MREREEKGKLYWPYFLNYLKLIGDVLLSLGEKLEREEVDILIKECCDPEDDDGFIPYERKLALFFFVSTW